MSEFSQIIKQKLTVLKKKLVPLFMASLVPEDLERKEILSFQLTSIEISRLKISRSLVFNKSEVFNVDSNFSYKG